MVLSIYIYIYIYIRHTQFAYLHIIITGRMAFLIAIAMCMVTTSNCTVDSFFVLFGT